MRHYLKASGVVAVGILGLHTASAQTADKPWRLSAAVRGFYDDNYSTAPSSPAVGQAGPQGSYGVEVMPSAGLAYSADTSDVKLDYTYSMKYYENRVNSADHSHQFDGSLRHRFSERYNALLKESFVIAQESQLLDPALSATPLRSNGDNIRNLVSLLFHAELVGPLSLDATYANGFYDYQDTGPGSFSALLDRIEHTATLDLRYKMQPTTTGLIGYQFERVDQTSEDLLNAVSLLLPDVRDRNSHFVYVGVDHNFTDKLSAHPRVGVQYTQYPNAPVGSQDDSVGPYADVSVRYTYGSDRTMQLGVRHRRTQTDIAITGAAVGAATQDAETTLVYASVDHRFTGNITANTVLKFQTSQFSQGGASDQRDNYFVAGVNLNYKINEFLGAEAGYNYDRLLSDLANRSFTRNRVYIGLRASY